MEFPGFIDVHVHFRDPGVPEAETTESGLECARRGGFAAVVAMPNTAPAGDSTEWIRRNAGFDAESDGVRLFSSACITAGRLGAEVAELEQLAEAGAVFFTDDGSYVADAKVMEAAMRRAKALGLAVCQHAMTKTDGVIRDCALARRLGLRTIAPETESAAIERDLSLCRTTGCRLHIQHISTARGVELVRGAVREGLPVTAEATPHHLLCSCDELTADDANYKMAPPLGNREDRAELRKAVKEGLLMFATDHAPHPARTKTLGFAKSANGIIGLETALAVTYEVMVKGEGMALEKWAEAWWKLPRTLLPQRAVARLEPLRTRIEFGEPRRWELAHSASRSRNCPYDGFTSTLQVC